MSVNANSLCVKNRFVQTQIFFNVFSVEYRRIEVIVVNVPIKVNMYVKRKKKNKTLLYNAEKANTTKKKPLLFIILYVSKRLTRFCKIPPTDPTINEAVTATINILKEAEDVHK